MRNREKYPKTEDAVRAYDAYCAIDIHPFTFKTWLDADEELVPAAVPLPAPMPTSARLAARREEVNAALRIRTTFSYELFRPRFGGTVLLRDVERIMCGFARRGATFDLRTDLDHMLSVNDCMALSSMPRWTVTRLIRKSPHFRLSRKVTLIKRSDFEEALERRSARRPMRRHAAA